MNRREAIAEAVRRWGSGSGASEDTTGHYVYAGELDVGGNWSRSYGQIRGRGASFEEAFADADTRAAIDHPLSPQSGARALEREGRDLRERADRAGLELLGDVADRFPSEIEARKAYARSIEQVLKRRPS